MKAAVTFSFTIAFNVFASMASAAEMDCRSYCMGASDACFQMGFRGRASALHINEMLNSAKPAVLLQWKASQCHRSIVANENRISSSGDNCTEYMDPFPGQPPDHENGSRSTIKGDFEGTKTLENGEVTLRFDVKTSPDFSFYQNGEVFNGGKVVMISHVPEVGGTGDYPRLLIQTTDMCYSID